MKTKPDRLKHGMLLDAKGVMDDALPYLKSYLKPLVPQALKENLETALADFEEELTHCDVGGRYEEISP